MFKRDQVIAMARAAAEANPIGTNPETVNSYPAGTDAHIFFEREFLRIQNELICEEAVE